MIKINYGVSYIIKMTKVCTREQYSLSISIKLTILQTILMIISMLKTAIIFCVYEQDICKVT